MEQKPTARVQAIDVIRGAIMVLMAIDHVRVYAGVPAGGPQPAVFFTRWVTHFCAPGFVFFAGAAAYLQKDKWPNRAGLSRWLLVRGAWLLLLELTWMRLCWTFNLDFANYLLAGVLWAIGWSLIALAGLIWLPLPAVGALGLAVIGLHDAGAGQVRAHSAALAAGSLGWLWKALYLGGSIGPLVILYTLIPWVGVIAAGWAFGPILRLSPERRRTWCFAIGGAAIAAFLLLRGLDLYGDPRPWSSQPPRMAPLLRFLNTTKYPASLLYLLMTLGPLISALPLVERARGPVSRTLAVFGRVPLFYYVLHIPLIHALALFISLVRTGKVSPWLFENHPMGMSQAPAGSVWSLPVLYLIAAAAVAMLYLPCRWYAELKARKQSTWLSLL